MPSLVPVSGAPISSLGDASSIDHPFPPVRGQVIAMVAYPYDPSIEVDIPGPPFPIGALPEEDDYLSYPLPGGTATVVAATEGFTSRPGDSPAHKWFAPLMANAFSFRVNLFNGIEPGASTRNGGPGGGEIEFADPAGRLDDAVSLGWAGRTVEIWRGPREAPFASYSRVAKLTSDGWTGLTALGKSLRLRDNQARLYSTPLVAATYAGTGGIDGDAGVKGRLKPQSYGYVFQVDPPLIDSANLIYQWHDRAVSAVITVKIGGVAWTNMGDHATYAALVAATLTNGQFATCNALGIFRLGGTPSHPVRVEGQGDVYDGVYASTRAAIVRRIATTRGALPIIADEIDDASFTALDAAQPAECGWHWNATLTVGDALDQIMQGVAGWWDIGLDARLSVKQLSEPSSTPDLVIDFDKAHPAGEPSREEDAPPRARTRVVWRQNYAPQDASQLTGSAQESAADQQLYGEPFRFGEREDSGVRVLWPTAREPIVIANYRNEVDADTESQRQQSLFGVKRERWNVPVSIDPFAAVRGITVEIRNWNRYGFGTSRRFRCVGVSTSGVDGITAVLSLWG